MAWRATVVAPEVLAFEDARRAIVSRLRAEADVRGFHGRVRFVRTTVQSRDKGAKTLHLIEIHETPEDKALRLSWERPRPGKGA